MPPGYWKGQGVSRHALFRTPQWPSSRCEEEGITRGKQDDVLRDIPLGRSGRDSGFYEIKGFVHIVDDLYPVPHCPELFISLEDIEKPLGGEDTLCTEDDLPFLPVEGL